MQDRPGQTGQAEKDAGQYLVRDLKGSDPFIPWYNNRVTYHLDRDELAMVKLLNSQFVASLNPFIQSLIDSGLQPAEPGKDCQRLNITEMLDKIGMTPRDKRDRNAIGAWLRAHNYVENNSTKKWDVTFRKVDNAATQE